jgi:hypothetical protein
MPDALTGVTLRDRLHQRGIAALLIRGENGRPRLGFLITARHTPEEIEMAVSTIAATALPLVSPTFRTISTPGIRTSPQAFLPIHHQN